MRRKRKFEDLNRQKEDVCSSAFEREGKVDEANKLLAHLTQKISTAEATRDQPWMDREAILQYCKAPENSLLH